VQAVLEPYVAKSSVDPARGPVTIEYQLGIDDVMALHKDNARRLLRANLWKVGLTVLLLLAASVPVLMQTLNSDFMEVWGMVAILVPLWVFILVMQIKRRQQALRKHIEGGRNRQLHGTRRLTISESGVQEETPYTMSRSAWQVIEKIMTTPGHIYICVGNLTVYLVPASAFASDAAREGFISTASAFHAAVARGNCKKCGYDLLGNTSGRCPECGQNIGGG